MRSIGFGVIVASVLAMAGPAWCQDEVASTLTKSKLLVREGVDDLGISVGDFWNCLSRTPQPSRVTKVVRQEREEFSIKPQYVYGAFIENASGQRALLMFESWGNVADNIVVLRAIKTGSTTEITGWNNIMMFLMEAFQHCKTPAR